jgi:hypothetical protein
VEEAHLQRAFRTRPLRAGVTYTGPVSSPSDGLRPCARIAGLRAEKPLSCELEPLTLPSLARKVLQPVTAGRNPTAILSGRLLREAGKAGRCGVEGGAEC